MNNQYDMYNHLINRLRSDRTQPKKVLTLPDNTKQPGWMTDKFRLGNNTIKIKTQDCLRHVLSMTITGLNCWQFIPKTDILEFRAMDADRSSLNNATMLLRTQLDKSTPKEVTVAIHTHTKYQFIRTTTYTGVHIDRGPDGKSCTFNMPTMFWNNESPRFTEEPDPYLLKELQARKADGRPLSDGMQILQDEMKRRVYSSLRGVKNPFFQICPKDGPYAFVRPSPPTLRETVLHLKLTDLEEIEL